MIRVEGRAQLGNVQETKNRVQAVEKVVTAARERVQAGAEGGVETEQYGYTAISRVAILSELGQEKYYVSITDRVVPEMGDDGELTKKSTGGMVIEVIKLNKGGTPDSLRLSIQVPRFPSEVDYSTIAHLTKIAPRRIDFLTEAVKVGQVVPYETYITAERALAKKP